MIIERASKTGFCYGVSRAIEILERIARERGSVETLGPIVHNDQVLQKLAGIGVRVVKDVDDVRGDTVALRAHGVGPKVEAELRDRHFNIIDTTCPFVRRAQLAARRLARSGFMVIVYGDVNHPEVQGILGWTGNGGVATMDEAVVSMLDRIPRRVGVLSQTTQVPAQFIGFVKKLIDSVFGQDSELRIVDTICHDIRKRQESALELASRVDLMLVVGGRNSANSKHLVELCSPITETHLVASAGEIQLSWFQGKSRVGVTSGASTDEQTISEVMLRLESLT